MGQKEYERCLELNQLFIQASRLDTTRPGNRTQKELESAMFDDVMKIFLRASFGRFRAGFLFDLGLVHVVKTPDEMAQILYQTGISPSVEEGRKLMPTLVGEEVHSNYAGIRFEEVTNPQGEKNYRISPAFLPEPF
jgi:hypothetical protein